MDEKTGDEHEQKKNLGKEVLKGKFVGLDMDLKVYNLAVIMHEQYEQAALETGWKTQESCQANFDNLPEKNKKVMLKVAEHVHNHYMEAMRTAFNMYQTEKTQQARENQIPEQRIIHEIDFGMKRGS